MFDNSMILIWLIILIVFIVIELVTVGLASIWFAAGALVALLITVAGGGLAIQIVAFFAVSILLLVATRPFVDKYVNARVQKTNVDDIIGKQVRITQRVCNLENTGAAFIDGKEWTVRASTDDIVIEKDQLAQIIAVSGVKLIVEFIQDMEENA